MNSNIKKPNKNVWRLLVLIDDSLKREIIALEDIISSIELPADEIFEIDLVSINNSQEITSYAELLKKINKSSFVYFILDNTLGPRLESSVFSTLPEHAWNYSFLKYEIFNSPLPIVVKINHSDPKVKPEFNCVSFINEIIDLKFDFFIESESFEEFTEKLSIIAKAGFNFKNRLREKYSSQFYGYGLFPLLEGASSDAKLKILDKAKQIANNYLMFRDFKCANFYLDIATKMSMDSEDEEHQTQIFMKSSCNEFINGDMESAYASASTAYGLSIRSGNVFNAFMSGGLMDAIKGFSAEEFDSDFHLTKITNLIHDEAALLAFRTNLAALLCYVYHYSQRVQEFNFEHESLLNYISECRGFISKIGEVTIFSLVLFFQDKGMIEVADFLLENHSKSVGHNVPESQKAEAFFRAGKICQSARNYSKAIDLYKQAFVYESFLGKEKNELILVINLINCMILQSVSYEELKIYILRAVALVEKSIKSIEKKFDLFKKYGKTSFTNGDYELSAFLWMKNMNLLENKVEQYRSKLAESYYELGCVFLEKCNYEVSLDFLKKGKIILDQKNNNLFLYLKFEDKIRQAERILNYN